MSQTPGLVQYWGGCPETPNSKWRRFQHLIQTCADRGWRTYLVWSRMPDDPALSKPFQEAGCKIILERRPDKNFDLRCVLSTFRLLRRVKCDVFHCHNVHTSPLIGAALARVPVRVWSKLSMSAAYESGTIPRGIHRFNLSTRISWILSHRVLAISSAIRDDLLSGGASPEKVLVFPEAVDWRAYCTGRDDGVRAALELRPDEVVVVSVGHAVRLKGWDLLISALGSLSSRFPKLRLLLVGSTSKGEEVQTMKELRAQVEQLHMGDKVVFAGRRGDIPQVLGASDIFVLPSRSEGMGFALKEAMAAGLPCLGARVGGIPEIITHKETGLLFEKDDVEGLAKALLGVLESNELRQRLAAHGQAYIKQFCLEATTEETIGLYEAHLGT
jgi:glycosyltransferase involved in cell wall biosynthesis